jgi:hypothetical protein
MENSKVEDEPVSKWMRAGRSLMEAFGKRTRVFGRWLEQPAKTKAATANKTGNSLCLNVITATERCGPVIRQNLFLVREWRVSPPKASLIGWFCHYKRPLDIACANPNGIGLRPLRFKVLDSSSSFI